MIITKAKCINIITLGLISITFLSGIILASNTTSAEDNTSVVDEINITVPVSCSLSGTGMTSHTATIENGRYVSDIGTTTLKAFCNDTNGFAIYATGYTGDVIGQENSNKLVGTPSTIGNISTGTATSGDTSNWSMKLATTSTPTPTYPITIDNSFDSYKEVPNEYTKVAHRDSSTDIGENAEGATLTTTYASYISKTQAAGAYSGKVIYTLVHPSNEEPPHEVACEAGEICYNANTATAVGEMGRWHAYNGVTLWAPNFKRTGYGFAGWNTKYDYTGTSYGPNETVATVPADASTNGFPLYAIWIPSHGTMQNWNGCSSMNIGDVTALTDSRDNDTYAVAKLADGKCWMIENLRLDNTPELSSTNTHNPSLPLTNIYDSSTTSNHLSPTSSVAYNATTAPEGWCQTGRSSCTDQSRLRTDNTTLFANNVSNSYSQTSEVYSYGNYYNWYSATAGHGKYGDEYSNGYISPGDICPAGWRLPIGYSATNEFDTLNVAMGGDKWRNYPNNLIYSGSAASVISDRGSAGFYWASSGRNTSTADELVITINGGTTVTSGNSKYMGRAIRCLSNV